MFKRATTTKRPKSAELPETWYLVDATDRPLGRLASNLAAVLIGKGKPTFDPAVLAKVKIVVINAEKIKLTGNKLAQKNYYRHSTYMGGLKTTPLSAVMQKNPGLVIQKAVSGMLPKNKLRKPRLANLKIYPNDAHLHIAQKPVKLEL